MPQTTTGSDALNFNPFREQRFLNPYPRYREVREVAPVYWSEELQLHFLLSYDAARQAITDFNSFSNMTTHLRAKPGTEPGPHLAAEMNWFMNADPPDHTPLRRFFGTAFTPRRVQALRERVEQTTTELLEHALTVGEAFDFVEALGFPLPTLVISTFIGAPTSDIKLFKAWSSALSKVTELDRSPETVAAANDAVAEAREYLLRLLAERTAEPREDLISYALSARDESLTDLRLVDNCILMLSAGHETTINFLGNALLALLDDETAMAQLWADESIVPSAIEELLRYDTPVQVTSRIATRDTELQGVDLQAGQRVVVFLGAANRDPQHFEEPDRLNLLRRPNNHIAFGHGAHHCLGAPIARLESEIVFSTMIRMFEAVELAGEAQTNGQVMTRGWKSIPIRVTPRRRR